MARSLRTRRRIFVEPLEDRTAPAFVAATSFSTGPNGVAGGVPVTDAVADFNDDGHLDVAVTKPGANTVAVLLGNGNGTFKPPVTYLVGKEPAAILAVDLNHDGKLDLVTANNLDDSVAVLLGTGTGTFGAAATFPAGDGPLSVAAGDLNGDGKIDLAVADNNTNTLTLLFGTADGKFTAGGTVTVDSSPTSVAIADFDNDQMPDLVSVSNGFGYLEVNLNKGDGTFDPKVNYATDFNAYTVAVADLDEDGQPDVVAGCAFPASGVSVLIGNPDGTFQPFRSYDTAVQGPQTVALADVNGDGHLDVVTANGEFANNSVSVLLGDGAGSLGPARVFAGGGGPEGIAAGDFNEDGIPDAVTGDRGGTVSLFLGNEDGTVLAAPDLLVQGASDVVAADFTGDGLPDLAVSSSDPSYSGVTLYAGLGNGTFGPGVKSPSIFAAGALAVGDFNGDGKNDLAVTGQTNVTVLIGNGDGTFHVSGAWTVATTPESVAVADFNGDGKLDLAVATSFVTDGGVYILSGNGDGTFGTPARAPTGVTNYVVAADLDGDGKADFVAVNNNVGVTPFFGNGDGTFVQGAQLVSGATPNAVAVGDLDGDGRPDLAISTFFGKDVKVFRNQGGRQFASVAGASTDSRPMGVVLADFNDDGLLDIAAACNFDDTAEVFLNTANGFFSQPFRYAVGDRPDWLTAADFTGDGRPDLAVNNGNANSLTLLQNPLPVTQFRVRPGDDVTTAGNPVRVTVSALDSFGHLVTGYDGSIGFTSSDTKATLPAAYKFAATDFGVRSFVTTLRTAGPQDVFVNGKDGTGAGEVTVVPGAATHLGVTVPATATAGSAFDLTVTALDAFDNVANDYTGTVRLSTDDPAAGVTLPADYAFTPLDWGTHTFTGGVTLVTAGAHTVSAAKVGSSWPLASGPVTVHAAAAAQLTVSAATTGVAGVPLSITVTARDPFGNVATDFTGSVTFASSDPQAVLPPDYTFTAGDNGVHTFQPVLKTAGPQTFTVASAGLADGQSGGVAVKPGTAAQLSFVGQPANTFVATPVKPSVSVRVFDAFGNPVAAGVKVLLSLATNPTRAFLRGASALTDATGLATFRLLAVSKAGVGYALSARAGTATGSPSSAFTVYKATHFRVTPSVIGRVVAGTSFTVTVTALDGLGRPDPTYTGTVHFTSTDTLADLPADYTFQPADGGVHTFTVTLKRSGLRAVTVADAGKPTVKGTKSLTVTAGALSQFLVTGFPLTTVHGVAHAFTVTAADAFGNRVSSYRGTVQFATAGGTATLPGPYTFKPLDAGRHVFKATFLTAGPGQSLTVTDQLDASISGTETGITVA